MSFPPSQPRGIGITLPPGGWPSHPDLYGASWGTADINRSLPAGYIRILWATPQGNLTVAETIARGLAVATYRPDLDRAGYMFTGKYAPSGGRKKRSTRRRPKTRNGVSRRARRRV